MINFSKKTAITVTCIVVLALVLQSFTFMHKKPFSNTQMSGINLFKAIYFNAGELRNNLEIIKEVVKTEDLGKETSANVDKLIAQISVSHPTFFEEFKNKVTSGNVQQIQKTLLEGSQVLAETAVTNYQGTVHKQSIKNKSIKGQGDIAVITFFMPYPDVWGVVILYPGYEMPYIMAYVTSEGIAGSKMKKNTLFLEKLAFQVAETFAV